VDHCGSHVADPLSALGVAAPEDQVVELKTLGTSPLEGINVRNGLTVAGQRSVLAVTADKRGDTQNIER
jgi:hypothetical protein